MSKHFPVPKALGGVTFSVAVKVGGPPVAVCESSCTGVTGVQVFEKKVVPTKIPLTVTLEIPRGSVASTVTLTVPPTWHAPGFGAVTETVGVRHGKVVVVVVVGGVVVVVVDVVVVVGGL